MPSGEKDIILAVFTAAFVLLILATLIVLLTYNYFKVKSRRHKEILKAVFETQEAERNRISEDLHDHIGGKMSALKLHNEIILSDSQSATVAEYSGKSSALIDSIVADIRKIVRNQASKYITENGIITELQNLARQVTESSGIQVSIRTEGPEPAVSNELKVAVFRILQELFHNSIKHSEANAITIDIFTGPELLKVIYTDNGKGFDPETAETSGMGIMNIRTRARLFDGEVSMQSVPFESTSCTLTFRLKSSV